MLITVTIFLGSFYLLINLFYGILVYRRRLSDDWMFIFGLTLLVFDIVGTIHSVRILYRLLS